jgi:hypothetical protein
VVLLVSVEDFDSVVALVADFLDFFEDFFLVEVVVVADPLVSVVLVSVALVSVFADLSAAFVGAGAACASKPIGNARATAIASAFMEAFFIAFSFFAPSQNAPGLTMGRIEARP